MTLEPGSAAHHLDRTCLGQLASMVHSTHFGSHGHVPDMRAWSHVCSSMLEMSSHGLQPWQICCREMLKAAVTPSFTSRACDWPASSA